MMSSIKHVFALMLENRSFDHMLGLSRIPGLNGLTGAETNEVHGKTFYAGKGARTTMAIDPAHEFPEVHRQLCGQAPTKGAACFAMIDNSGFASSYFAECSKKKPSAKTPPEPGDVMASFDPVCDLPVLNSLAEHFAVCDAWHSSMPGSTWPNRFFALAGTSGGMDYSPGIGDLNFYRAIRGFQFENGTLFDRPIKSRIYSDSGILTNALALRGVRWKGIESVDTFCTHVKRRTPEYDAAFTWIEPDYGHVLREFEGGSSQHPLQGVAGGEGLIKKVYEAIRQSPIWESSLLIITWDEHGGFYDHMAPPPAIPPCDRVLHPGLNKYGFDFSQSGPRVPAVIVSPFTAPSVDSTARDHTSILSTVEHLFGLHWLTQRDRHAQDLLSLVTESENMDTPWTLPDPFDPDNQIQRLQTDALDTPLLPATRPEELVDDDRSLLGFLYLATRAYLQSSRFWEYPRIYRRRAAVRTRADARDYLEEVRRAVAMDVRPREEVR